MQCALCGSPAARSYTRKTAAGDVTVTLCEKCREELYPEGGTDAIFSSFLVFEDAKKKCPACGATLDDFRRTGLLGCADCYKAFRDELIPTVRSVQGKLRHEGVQQPSAGAAERYDTVRRLADEKAELQDRIEEARAEGDDLLLHALEDRLAAIKQRLAEEGNR